METKLNPAKLYMSAIKRSKRAPVSEETRTFSNGGALMGRVQNEQDTMPSNMSIEDRVREIYSAQRQMLKESL